MSTESQYYEEKFASISTASSGDQEIVAAATGRKIRVLSYVLVVQGDVDVTWKSSTTALSGALSFPADGDGIAPPYCPYGLMETVAGEALNLNLSGAVQVSGHITYALVSENE